MADRCCNDIATTLVSDAFLQIFNGRSVGGEPAQQAIDETSLENLRSVQLRHDGQMSRESFAVDFHDVDAP